MAQKRLNKNVVIGLTLFGFFCMIVASILMLRQLQKVDPRHFEALAEQCAKQEQWQQATAFYAKAWDTGQDPKYLVARGDMVLADGDVSGALYLWGEALVKQPNLLAAHQRRLDLLLEAARLYGKLDHWHALRDAAEAFLKLEEPPPPAATAAARHALGLALLNLRDAAPENAAAGVAALEEAANLAPETADYSLDLAGAYIEQGQVESGERILDALGNQHTTPGATASKVQLALAQHRARRRAEGEESPAARDQRFREAEVFFQKAVELAGDDAEAAYEARLGHAVFVTQKWAQAQSAAAGEAAAGLFTEAEKLLQECINARLARFDASLQLATLYRAAHRYDDVVGVCERRLARGFSRRGIQASRDKFDTFRLMLLASEACVANAMEGEASKSSADRDEWFKKAQRYLDDAGGEYPAHPRVLSQSGRLKLARGLDRAALEDLRKAEEAYGGFAIVDWENKVILARLHLQLGEPGAAKQVLEDVIGRVAGKSAVPVWLLYARTLLMNNELDNPELDRALAQVFLYDPANAEGRQLQAAVFERKGLTGRARTLVDSPSVAALLRARELALGDDLAGAVAVLGVALQDAPGDPQLVSTTVQALLNLQRTGEAADIVRRALEAAPDEPMFRRLAVVTREGLSEPERIDALRELLQSEPDALQRALNLADFFIRTRELPKALEQLDAAEQHLVAKDTPAAQASLVGQHAAVLELKMQIAAQLKDSTAMEAARDAAARHDVDGAGGKTLLGFFHMYRDEWDAAILALRAAVDAQPTHVRSLNALGFCLHKLGEVNEAKETYERALRVSANEAAAHKGLAMLAKDRGDADAYATHLAACERLAPADPWVRREVLARQEQADPRGAITRREAELQQHPDDPVNLYRLATLCEAVQELPKADEYYRQLLALRPDDREVVVAASKYFRRTGRPERSLAVVTAFADARRSPEEKADALILTAAHLLSEGQADQVEKTLLTAASLAETFEVCHSLAEFYLRSGGRADKALTWYDRAAGMARRDKSARLSGVLAARIACAVDRSVDDLNKARQFVEEFRGEFPDDPRGFLWEGEIYTREGRLEEAVAALSRYLEQRPEDAYGRFQRAQLYAGLGRSAPAVEDLEAVKLAEPAALEGEPRLLLARLHEQAGRKDAALREYESLVADAPHSLRAVEALVGAYIRQKRFANADRVVTAQINRTEAQPDPRWYFLRGTISLELNDAEKTLADFHRAADLSGHSADSVAAVLEVHARLRRAEQGVRYYEQYAPATGRTVRLLSRYARLLADAGRAVDAVAAFRQAADVAEIQAGGAMRTVTGDLYAAFPDASAALALFEGQPPPAALARANDRILVRFLRTADRVADAVDRLKRLAGTATTDAQRADLLLELGELHQVAGNNAAARTAYEEAVRYEPGNWQALNNLAYVLSDQLQEPKLALPYAKAAVKSASNADTLDTLGWIYVHLGDFRLATAELTRALQLNPDLAIAYYHLAEAYRRGQQFTPAADLLTTGIEVATLLKDTETLDLMQKSRDRVSRRDASP
ncbi:MAG: tetratricopeptide repeat protein [Planctomycetes bacterium]|nr:tetratricopeptide repeat protein [Planctomycetota bacterium]